jgi:hypothetical protein
MDRVFSVSQLVDPSFAGDPNIRRIKDNNIATLWIQCAWVADSIVSGRFNYLSQILCGNILNGPNLPDELASPMLPQANPI